MQSSKQFLRFFSLKSYNLKKATSTNMKGKKLSSQLWLTRQLTDPYVEKAKMMNYRCRSAFKLIEIDDRYKLFNSGQVVIDCGAAPGSWTQIAVQRTNANGINLKQTKGLVVSIDLQHIYPIDGAILLGNSDFTTPETQKNIFNQLNERKANIVLSDMAPNATGIKEMDDDNILKLCYQVLRFAVQVSERNGHLLMKLWQCEARKHLEQELSRFYETVKIAKPQSSRSESAEIFLLARNFKGLKT